jgi:hypothetical protein
LGSAEAGAAVVVGDAAALLPPLPEPEPKPEPLEEQAAMHKGSAAQATRAAAPLPDIKNFIRVVSLSVAFVVRRLRTPGVPRPGRSKRKHVSGVQPCVHPGGMVGLCDHLLTPAEGADMTEARVLP